MVYNLTSLAYCSTVDCQHPQALQRWITERHQPECTSKRHYKSENTAANTLHTPTQPCRVLVNVLRGINIHIFS